MEIKEPQVEDKNSFAFLTSIWIVPFIALIIALWLVYEYYSKQGPEIKIEFSNSGGLTAGQSVIKFRDVPVGKVEKIEINNEKEGVIVYARVNKDAKDFLNETTKFWIVQAKVDYSGIQGLDTLLTGSYINMYAKKGKERKYEFIGLNGPYVGVDNADYYVIESTFPVKVKKTTPVYFKGVQVGEVDNINLDTSSKNIVIVVKINQEYKDLVNKTTKFWVQGLVNLQLNDNRLDVNMAPLSTLLLGGIEFNSKFDKNYTKDSSKIYRLYKNEVETNKNRIKYVKPIMQKVAFHFKGDVSSVDIGMAIKYKGIKIGEVEQVDIGYDRKREAFKAFCLGEIDIANFGENRDDAIKNFDSLKKRGVIATLKKSPLFNKSTIILKQSKEKKNAIKKDLVYNALVFPTKEFKNSDILASITDLTKKLEKLNLNKTLKGIDDLLADSRSVVKESKKPIKKLTSVLNSTNKVLNSTNKLVKDLDKLLRKKDIQKLGKNINKVLIDLKKTLKTTTKTVKGYSSDSLFGDKLEDTLRELHNTSEQTNRLLRKLNKKPNSLIFGD
jgi:paraquat-inducible protein B